METPIKPNTPLINRIFFGLITIIIILFVAKMAYEVISPAYQGNGSGPPFSGDMILFGLMAVGFILITFRGHIRLRLHKIWTPLGLLSIFWIWLTVLKHFLPISHGVVDALLNHSYEAWIFGTGFGLMLAFVDFPPLLYQSAYYFIPSTLYSAIFLVVGVYGIFTILIGRQPEFIHISNPNFFAKWDEFNDFFYFISGAFFAYSVILRLKKEWPGWKKIGITLGIFIASAIAVMFIGNMIGNALPKDSRLGQWFTGNNTGQHSILDTGKDQSNEKSQTIIKSRREQIEISYPEFKDFENQESFAGHKVTSLFENADLYVTYEVLGSGVPIAQATCFRVDSENQVYKIGEFPDMLDSYAGYRDVDPKTCSGIK